MKVLEVRSVSKSYSHHKALDDVSLSVPEGQIFGLLGPNGAGKTSLIRIINQITIPDQGDILFKGNSLSSEHVKTKLAEKAKSIPAAQQILDLFS